MMGFARSVPARLGRAVRRRPRVTALVVAAAVIGAAGALYGYAVSEWRRAAAAVRAGHPAEARDRLGFCLAVWPRDPAVHRLAARAAWLTGDHASAEDHLNTCLRLEKGASEATQLEFLLIRAQTGETDEVGGLLFDFVAAGHPDSALILETIASAYMHELRYGPAYACLNRWVQLFPDSARPYHFRGWVLERMNQPSEALEDYLRALERDPALNLVRLRIAEMYLEDKDPVRALPHLEELLRRDPDRAEAQARLGQCLYLQGRAAEARRLLEAAAPRLPADAVVLLYLARLDLDDGQPDRAVARLRRALELEPSEIEARFALVGALRALGQDAAAAAELDGYNRQKADLEKANHLLQAEAKAHGGDPGSAFEIGTLLMRIHRDPQALHWLNEALARDPDYQPAHRALADYYERTGDRNQAAAHRRQLRPD